jgi:glycosyltransferase involved in cell wall biosynthesis
LRRRAGDPDDLLLRSATLVATLLTINNYHYRRGGADVAYLDQSDLFRRKGWEVASFSMTHPQNLPSPWSSYFVKEIEFGSDYSPLRVLENSVKSIYSLEAAAKVRELVRKVRPNIAHAHNVYHHLSPSVLGAIKAEGVPLFMTLHDLKLLCPSRTMWTHGQICEACKGGRLRNVVKRRCMKGSLALSSLIYVESTVHQGLRTYQRNVDKLIAPSKFVLGKFLEWGWPAQQLVHIPNFVDVTRFVPNFTAGRAFLYFGRLSDEKGLITLTKAAALARVPLWLVGSGPEEQELRALAESLGTEVTFYGFKTGDALWDLVRAARAVVLPSECYENAPMSILEAYAVGKPVIGARVGGIPELVRDDETGCLFESQNVDELARVLARVASMDDATVERWGREGRSWIAQEFSSARYYDRLVELYSQYGMSYKA